MLYEPDAAHDGMNKARGTWVGVLMKFLLMYVSFTIFLCVAVR